MRWAQNNVRAWEVSAESGIYAIVDMRTDGSYVGSSSDMERRCREHLYALRAGSHYAKRLQEAWTQDGPRAFAFCVVAQAPPETLLLLEQVQIDFVATHGLLYNSSVKARGGPPVGVPRTLESRQKQSATMKGKPKPAGFAAKVSEALKGRPKSPEHVEKSAASQRGKTLSLEHRAKLSAAGIGRVVSAETRRKMSASMKATLKRQKEQ